MFSYYALETWLFTFFCLFLFAFFIYYTRRLCLIFWDMNNSKKVSYEPWKEEKKWGKIKERKRSRPFIRLPILTIPVIKYGKAQETQTQAQPAKNRKLELIENGLNRNDRIAGSYESFQSFETTTTNSEFYRDPRLSIDLTDNRPLWFVQSSLDQNQNYVSNNNVSKEVKITINPIESIARDNELKSHQKQSPEELNVSGLQANNDSEQFMKIEPKKEPIIRINNKVTMAYEKSSKSLKKIMVSEISMKQHDTKMKV